MNTTSVVACVQGMSGRKIAWNMGLVVCGSVVVALGAQVALPLPFTDVPITLQTLAVLMVGASVGWKRAGAALVLYLAQGAAGLPVFAGGAAGVVHVFGPSGGYLLGFVPAAMMVGWWADRGWCRSISKALLVMVVGTAIVFICGVGWRAMLFGGTFAIVSGLVPFVPGAIVKIVFGVAGAAKARSLLGRLGAAMGVPGDCSQ